MFDYTKINKAYKIQDNITGNNVEVVNFNATIGVDIGVMTEVNISYPNLYNNNLAEITEAYKTFQADVYALAVAMNVVHDGILDTLPPSDGSTTNPANKSLRNKSALIQLNPITDVLREEAKKVMDEILQSLDKVEVNTVPKINPR